MITFFWNTLFFLVALGILVAVHEWGHFFVARRCGVKVHRFSIGFGKILFSRIDKYGTEFVVSAVPLGGYVKMLDSRVDEVSPEQRAFAFDLKPVGQRIAIIAAGPLINFVFAIFALALMYSIGVDKVKPIVGQVSPDSIAAVAGIPTAAEIVAVGERETGDWNQISLEMISHIGGDTMSVSFRPDGQSSIESRTLFLSTWNFDPDAESVFTSLGITPYYPDVTTTLSMVSEQGAAHQYGLQVDDKIVAIDGVPMEQWQQVVSYVSARPNTDVVISILRQQQALDKRVVIGESVRDNKPVGYLGVLGTRTPWPDGMVFKQQMDPLSGLLKGAAETWRLTTLSFSLIGKLLTGDLSVNTLSGPISIAQGAGASASVGFVYFLSFLALISVNLGVVNLLPLPVLDGGHIVYFTIEWIKGSPVAEHIQQAGYKLGGLLILMIMSIAIFNDLGRI